MVRKLFIVAQGNEAVYRQLHVTVGREPDVEIIYDRRPVPRKPRAVNRLLRPLRRLVSRRPKASVLEHLDRRQQRAIDEEIAKKGFAVVRVEDPGPRASHTGSRLRARLVIERDVRLPDPAAPPPEKDSPAQLEQRERSIS